MAWTAPMTFIPNTALTAAQLNTHLRDNLLETGPGKATGATGSGYFVVERPGLLGRRVATSHAIHRVRTTSSGAWTDLDYVSGTIVGPTVKCRTGKQALIMISSLSWKTGTSDHKDTCMVALQISGATERAPDEQFAYKSSQYHDGRNNGMFAYICEDLNPGINVFQMKYQVTGDQVGFFTNSQIVILPL